MVWDANHTDGALAARDSSAIDFGPHAGFRGRHCRRATFTCIFLRVSTMAPAPWLPRESRMFRRFLWIVTSAGRQFHRKWPYFATKPDSRT